MLFLGAHASRTACTCLLALTVLGCSGEGSDPADVGTSELEARYTTTDHDRIASENGEVTLEAGKIAGLSISLIDEQGELFPWIQEQTIDLGARNGRVPAESPPPGSYVAFTIRVAPPASGSDSFQALIRSDTRGELRVRYDNGFERERGFDSGGSLLISEGDSVELQISLLTLFFYTWPFDRAVDGVFHAQGVIGTQETLELNLANSLSPAVTR